MSNRVEELESQVAELQAAVDGLTEELVETRERLRSLESEHDIEVKRAPDPRDDAAADGEQVESPTDETEADTETEEVEGDGESGDSDIIVA